MSKARRRIVEAVTIVDREQGTDWCPVAGDGLLQYCRELGQVRTLAISLKGRLKRRDTGPEGRERQVLQACAR